MQVFLVAYAVVSIAEIFSVGGFLTDRKIVVVSLSCYRHQLAIRFTVCADLKFVSGFPRYILAL